MKKRYTKNKQLSALADRLALAIYTHNRQENGRDMVPINAGGQRILMEIIGGVDGVRQLVDAYFLEAMEQNFHAWEPAAAKMITLCLNGYRLNSNGKEIWQSMLNDMGDAAANQGPRHD